MLASRHSPAIERAEATRAKRSDSQRGNPCDLLVHRLSPAAGIPSFCQIMRRNCVQGYPSIGVFNLTVIDIPVGFAVQFCSWANGRAARSHSSLPPTTPQPSNLLPLHPSNAASLPAVTCPACLQCSVGWCSVLPKPNEIVGFRVGRSLTLGRFHLCAETNNNHPVTTD